jgi:hypothetical protein
MEADGRDHVFRRGSAVRLHGGITFMQGERRLQALAVAHLALGVVTGILAPVELSAAFELRHILIVPFIASALCQGFMISLWAAASQATPWKRLAGLVTAAVYLEALVGPDLRREFLGISTITIAVTAGALLVLRWLGVGLTRHADGGQPAQPEPEGLRFSIRDLMLFTAAVALLCAGARALHASTNRVLMLLLVWALCFVAVGLVSLWAALGDARPLRRGPVVFVLSPVLGVFFAFAANAHSEGWVYILLIMLLYPAALLASLLVVRSCNYRLVRRAVPSTGPPDDGGGCETAVGVCESARHRPGSGDTIPNDKAPRTGPPSKGHDSSKSATAGRVRCSARLGGLQPGMLREWSIIGFIR